jgi:hypothetical protein
MILCLETVAVSAQLEITRVNTKYIIVDFPFKLQLERS